MNNHKEILKNLEDTSGDAHLKLAEELIAQGSFDEACENLLFCLHADTMVRELAYPLIVELLAKGHCIDKVSHDTFEWLRLACYVEPDQKKAMYRGIAFGTEKPGKIANALACYVTDFGGDETVGEMYDRLEELTFEQMPYVDYYDYCYYELTHDALCDAIENGLSPSALSDNRLISVYFHTSSENVLFAVLEFIYEHDKRDLAEERELFSSHGANNESIKNAIVRLAEHYAEKKDYEKLAWLYRDLTSCDNAEMIFDDCDEVNERIHAPVYQAVLASDDPKTVAAFFENAFYGGAAFELRKQLCDFVMHNYLDENGNVREAWSRTSGFMESVFTVLTDYVFYIANGECKAETVYGGYDKRAVKIVFEKCRPVLDELLDRAEIFNSHLEEQDGGLCFVTFDEYYIDIDDPEVFLSKIRETLKEIEEKYCV